MAKTILGNGDNLIDESITSLEVVPKIGNQQPSPSSRYASDMDAVQRLDVNGSEKV